MDFYRQLGNQSIFFGHDFFSPEIRNNKKTNKRYPLGSMYGICTYIYHRYHPHVGKYTIHGSYGKAPAGFAFLLHGAVRFCAGYCGSKEMVCLAIFSYFIEVAQLGTLLQYSRRFWCCLSRLSLFLFHIYMHIIYTYIYIHRSYHMVFLFVNCSFKVDYFVSLERYFMTLLVFNIPGMSPTYSSFKKPSN